MRLTAGHHDQCLCVGINARASTRDRSEDEQCVAHCKETSGSLSKTSDF